ncbi:hypothetical protein, partial [Poseidonibacter sp.]|uniref:hypothetical protein n=1 Tax=Poseidonibacter sp. TaxID=2321188 RepID=UPI003C73BD7C
MIQEIGKINSLNGSFFIKDAEGNLTTAKIGDTVYSGDIIVGSGSNSNSDSIKIILSDNSKEIELYGDNEQLFDETMLSTELSSDTVIQDEELNESLLLEESTQNEVDPNLTQATLTAADIENLDAAAAGAEPTDAGVLLARLEDRTGAEVDVNTNLLDATITGSTATVTDEDALVIQEETFIPPTIVVNSGIGEDNIEVTEGINDYAVFTIDITDAATGSTLALSFDTIGEAKNGADYNTIPLEYSLNGVDWFEVVLGTVPLSQGDNTVFVRTDIFDDTLVERSEDFTLNATLISNDEAYVDSGSSTIIDTDSVSYAITESSTVTEGGVTTVTYTVTQTGDLEAGVSATMDYA